MNPTVPSAGSTTMCARQGSGFPPPSVVALLNEATGSYLVGGRIVGAFQGYLDHWSA